MQILTPFAGEVLVLVMLIFLNARILFTRRTRHDALAILAPLSVVVIILQMLAWEIRFAEIVIFALALITAILNYRSIVRFSQDLFVDSYSVKFFVASILLLLVSIFVLAAAIVMRPVQMQIGNYNVQVQREYFSCAISPNFSEEDFREANEISDKRNFTLYTFSNKNVSAQKNTVVLFVGDVLAETMNYEPYLILLARAGYTVLAADLYGEDFSDFRNLKPFRRFFLLANFFKAKNPPRTKSNFANNLWKVAPKIVRKFTKALTTHSHPSQKIVTMKKDFLSSAIQAALCPQKNSTRFLENIFPPPTRALFRAA